MRVTTLLLGALSVLAQFAAAEASGVADSGQADIGHADQVPLQESAPVTDEAPEQFKYDSDISRLRSLVIHSLYSHKDVFLRELLSNANDALEKLRIVSLTDRSVLSAGDTNVTIEVRLDEDGDGKTGQLILRDTGIGMNRTELVRNLGTIARSGTNEFLKKADEAGNDGNLIGQFGLGFYSCFLVSPTVRVASLPPPTPDNPNPQQYVFISEAKGDTFEVLPDPRGNTLGRGTEIVLQIGEEDKEFLSINKLKALIDKHSTFSTTFPIYIRERKQTEEGAPAEMVWTHVNDKAPIWMREPSSISDEEYIDFYRSVSKGADPKPLGWSHFRGDTASGVSYRAIMYIPSTLPKDFWQKIESGINNVRLMVKRVFITDDLGKEYMPRWLSFVKITVDADDLPLNVSRETLQNARFLQQLKRTLVRKALDLLTRLAEEKPEEYQEVSKLYGNALRIGAIETQKDRIKIAKLLRFESTRTNYTSLEEYVANRKEGQKQIYYMAGVGENPAVLARSPFVEKLKARGYEVLLLNLPSDEPMMQSMHNFMGMLTQDVAKKGLTYGDEEEDAAEQRELESQKIAFRPLTDWLKGAFRGRVSDVVLTNRLVTSPCTIVVDSMGWSANMARIMAAQGDAENDPMYQVLKNMPRVLEINPKSPLIEGLLSRVLDLPPRVDGEESGEASLDELELIETANVLFDSTLVRSGFDVPDPTAFFERVEALLRTNLGVRLDAKTDESVKPAPPTAAELPAGAEDEKELDAQADDDSDDTDEKNEEDPLAKLQKLVDSQVGHDHAQDSGPMNDDDFLDWASFKKSLEHDEL